MKSFSNVYLIGLALAMCIILANAASVSSDLRSKPRAIRGFKNAALSTARGFGKRDGFYQNFESPNDIMDDTRKTFQGDYKDPMESFESLPVEWFVEELANNPRLARLIVKKFIDLNQDGELSVDELLRSGGY